MAELMEMFLAHKGEPLQKYKHHIAAYDELFRSFRDKGNPCVMEIGLDQGGSVQLWRKYFGPGARIVGIDIKGNYAHLVNDNIEVYFGNQSDKVFLKYIKEVVDNIDILIDDAGHESQAQIVCFEELFPQLSDGGIYICEDIHTSYRPGLAGDCSFVNYMKNIIDCFHIAEFADTKSITYHYVTHCIESISFYRSLMVMRKNSNAHKVCSPLLLPGG